MVPEVVNAIYNRSVLLLRICSIQNQNLCLNELNEFATYHNIMNNYNNAYKNSIELHKSWSTIMIWAGRANEAIMVMG
ncbi:hypothetical protein ACJIZ3_013004 [Penstemon smallii]|uniref:Uncharacterized protein n=1 Tax=Penstemon smallii TaxID=265156 RepID=A0ABD3US84_9LAMI